jgi:hypothetical protein
MASRDRTAYLYWSRNVLITAFKLKENFFSFNLLLFNEFQWKHSICKMNSYFVVIYIGQFCNKTKNTSDICFYCLENSKGRGHLGGIKFNWRVILT